MTLCSSLAPENCWYGRRPGPSNALGLVKLMFPNEYHVCLHSTPSQELFSQSRRDFSAGCIRVEKAAELAAWVLRDKPEWTLERVRAAMQSGKDNAHVNLARPVPVLIIYGTAVVDEENQVHFFDDLYGHDSALEKALALFEQVEGRWIQAVLWNKTILRIASRCVLWDEQNMRWETTLHACVKANGKA